MKKLILIISLFFISQTAIAAEECTAEVKVNGLVCDFCAQALEKVFGKREEVAGIHVNLDNGFVHVTFNEGKSIDDATLKSLITDSGYNITGIDRSCS